MKPEDGSCFDFVDDVSAADHVDTDSLNSLSKQGDLARRRKAIQSARGMWKARVDLPDFERLREELDRH